jgi:hypothetical protein
MQIGSADTGSADRDDYAVRPGQRGVRSGFDANAGGSVNDYGAHTGVLTFLVAERI